MRGKPHQYSVGDIVTEGKPGIILKLSFPWDGPYAVTAVHDSNGTITIQKEPFVTDWVNIRRVKPFHAMKDQGNT